MSLNTMHDLMISELKDLYSAETQLVKALPKMRKAAAAESLQMAFETHLAQTQEHVARLEQIFEEIGTSPRGKKCAAMEGLIEEGSEMAKEDADPSVRDAGLIAAAQRVEHYEIAAYGSTIAFAKQMGHDSIVELLTATLNEEKTTDELLTTLALEEINPNATGADMEGDESDDDSADEDEAVAVAAPAGKSGKAPAAGSTARPKSRS